MKINDYKHKDWILYYAGGWRLDGIPPHPLEFIPPNGGAPPVRKFFAENS